MDLNGRSACNNFVTVDEGEISTIEELSIVYTSIDVTKSLWTVGISYDESDWSFLLLYETLEARFRSRQPEESVDYNTDTPRARREMGSDVVSEASLACKSFDLLRRSRSVYHVKICLKRSWEHRRLCSGTTLA